MAYVKGVRSMKSYRYTTLREWNQACEEGFLPVQEIRNEEVIPFIGKAYGIWVWNSSPKGIDHMYNILFQAATKEATQIVKLCIEIHRRDILHNHEGRRVTVNPSLKIGKMSIEPLANALIITHPIHISRVTKVGEYNLLDRLK